ncbi:WD repeat-containing protein 76-like isoform X2 [Rhopilema esculentum]|uniref:WD repeat-containing protein 76-like isoform X2 n=1 Tax=Rhopilema esculentum TaxID=499914 RepID=UPI0031DC42A7
MLVQRKSTRLSGKRKLEGADSSVVNKSPKKSRKVEISGDRPHSEVKRLAVQLTKIESKNEPNGVNEDSDEELASVNGDDEQQLTSYELERLLNIQKNESFFKQLNFHEAKSSFNESIGKPPRVKRTEKYGLKREKKEKIQEPVVRRVSMRIRRMDPTGLPLPELPDSKGAFQVRKSSEALKMESYNNIENDICKNVIQEWCNHCNQKTTHTKSGEEFDFERYKKGIQNLSIADNHAAKVVPERIFALTVHPMETKLLVFAGDKWGKVGIWDVDSKEGHDGVFLFEPHTRPINVISLDPCDDAKVFTCSYDGTIRCGDLHNQQFLQVYETPEEDDILINAFCWVAKSKGSIMVAKNDYTVGLVDVRSGKEENNFVAHAKSVRWVDCHPVNEHYVVTSCQDGSVATWDLRKTKNIKSKLSEVWGSRVASSAYFSPQTGNQVLVTSLDDTIRVYDVNINGTLNNQPRCNIRHNNQTGRWLTKFRATWDPKTDNCFVVGSMNRPRAVDFYNTDGKGTLITQMWHENFTSITSLNTFHPTLNLVAGGNSSGKVFIWK